MTAVAAAGYALAAVLFGVLTLLLATQWRGRAKGGYLLAASVVSTVWAGLHAWQILYQTLPPNLLLAAESLRYFTWLLFLLAVLSPVAQRDPAYRRALAGAHLVLFGLVAVVLLSLDDYGPVGAVAGSETTRADLKLIGQLLLAVWIALDVVMLLWLKKITAGKPTPRASRRRSGISRPFGAASARTFRTRRSRC